MNNIGQYDVVLDRVRAIAVLIGQVAAVSISTEYYVVVVPSSISTE